MIYYSIRAKPLLRVLLFKTVTSVTLIFHTFWAVIKRKSRRNTKAIVTADRLHRGCIGYMLQNPRVYMGVFDKSDASK